MFLLGGWDALRGRLDEWLPEGSLRARFARGTFWSALGVIISQLLALAASVVVARIFGKTSLYGDLSAVRVNAMMFGVFAGFSLGTMTTKYVAEFRESDPARAGRIIGLSAIIGLASTTLVALAMVFAAPWLAGTMNAPHLVVEMRLAGLLLFFEALNGLQTGALAGFEAFKNLAALSLIRGLLYFPIVVGAVALGSWLGGPDSVWPLRAAVLGLATTAALGCAINAVALRRLARARGVPIRYRGAFAEAWAIGRYALPAFLSGVVSGGALWQATRMLMHAADGSSLLGIYNAANQWQLPVTLLAMQLQAALLPMLSSFSGDDGGRKRGETIQDATFLILTVAVLPSVAFFASFAEPIMQFYGKSFGGHAAMVVLCAALFVGGTKAFGTIPGTAVASHGHMWSGLAINLAWATVLLTFLVLWMPQGVVGYANAFCVAHGFSVLLGVAYCAVRGLSSWRLALQTLAATALLALFSYGAAYAEGWPAKGALCVVAIAIATTTGWAGWRKYRSNRAG